jgi:hypothetical protein
LLINNGSPLCRQICSRLPAALTIRFSPLNLARACSVPEQDRRKTTENGSSLRDKLQLSRGMEASPAGIRVIHAKTGLSKARLFRRCIRLDFVKRRMFSEQFLKLSLFCGIDAVLCAMVCDIALAWPGLPDLSVLDVLHGIPPLDERTSLEGTSSLVFSK